MADDEATARTAQARAYIPAVEGWFTVAGGHTYLLGSRCVSCRTIVFPPHRGYCRNPHCDGERSEEIRLSRRGRIWSYTTSAYPPPPPFVASDPYVPVAIAAVELEAEQIVVLGQVASDTPGTELAVGMEMELTTEPLFDDGQTVHLVWKWRRAGQDGADGPGADGPGADGRAPSQERGVRP
jgi:uncharacterized OB-fold protein